MNKQKTMRLAIGLILVVVGLVACGLIIDQFEQWQKARPQRLAAERHAFLNQSVRGHVSDKDAQSAGFRYTTMAYFGGYLQEWDYADGLVGYRNRPGMPGTPDWRITITPTDEQQELLLDVLNLTAKQKLWNQADVQEDAADGGESEFAFSIGHHQGQFKLINTNPSHLDRLSYKCWQLMESFEKAARIGQP